MKPLHLLPLLLLPLLLGLASSPRPAAAQCVYTAEWTFDQAVPAEWAANNFTWSSGLGYSAPGALNYFYGSLLSSAYTGLTAAELAAAMGLPDGTPIPTDGLEVTAAARPGAGATRMAINVVAAAGGYDVTDTTAGEVWTLLNVQATAGDELTAVNLSIFGSGSVTGAWDDVTITLPCEAIPPTPTPEPTPTIDPAVAILPSQYVTVALNIDPIPMPDISDTIDLAVFWDVGNFEQMLRIVRTFFYFENIPQFFKVFLFVMGIVIGLRLILALVSNRAEARRNQSEV